MRTIQLQIDDDLYEELIDHGVNFKAEIGSFLRGLVDDGYPTVTTQEGRKRVAEAVERYRSGKGIYMDSDAYEKHNTDFLLALENKYANR